MFSFLKPKPIFPPKDQERIMESIREAEKRTSGEIRLYVESRCPHVEAIDRAVEIFNQLKMEQTAQRNGVLVYVAFKDQQLAIYGDKGIYEKTGEAFWKKGVEQMLAHFNKEDHITGLVTVIKEIGEALYEHFPYDGATDKNELPDDIVFGK